MLKSSGYVISPPKKKLPLFQYQDESKTEVIHSFVNLFKKKITANPAENDKGISSSKMEAPWRQGPCLFATHHLHYVNIVLNMQEGNIV